MNKQLQRNRLLIVSLFALSIIPVMIAWGLFLNPNLLSGSTNLGKLIIPPIPTERTDLQGIDPFSKANMKELSGRWIIVNTIPGNQCASVCKEAIHKTKQLRLMLNKDLTRTRRLVILFSETTFESAKSIWAKDERLLRAKPNQNFLNQLSKITKLPLPDGMLLLMDPLGNLMMQYDPGFSPYHVMKDLKKLLKVSQIG